MHTRIHVATCTIDRRRIKPPVLRLKVSNMYAIMHSSLEGVETRVVIYKIALSTMSTISSLSFHFLMIVYCCFTAYVLCLDNIFYLD